MIGSKGWRKREFKHRDQERIVSRKPGEGAQRTNLIKARSEKEGTVRALYPPTYYVRGQYQETLEKSGIQWCNQEHTSIFVCQDHHKKRQRRRYMYVGGIFLVPP